ncbi:MAG: endo-1,4-beta-xylanase [Lacipirellulaceae bacterium]
MGLLRFVAHRLALVDDERLARAYVAGADEAPYFTRVLRSGDTIVAERSDTTSGAFTIPWPVPDQGDWLLATSTLMERERPYLLEVELARGQVFRLRDQLAAWENLGLVTPGDLRASVADASRLFNRAATRQDDVAEAADYATQAIGVASAAACRLADVYAEQALALRMQQGADKLTTLLGVRMAGQSPTGEAAALLRESCNLIAAPCGWGAVEPSEGRRDWSESDRPIEWARSQGLRVCGGPLLEFDERRLPDWAYLWEGDVDTLASLMVGHVRAAAQRYKGRVQLWNVASRVNRDRVLSLTDEQRLRIVAAAVSAVRQVDPQTPVVVGVEQPWGEYRARRDSELTPMDFADALERADLGIAGFDLELNIGYHPHATALRSPLSLSRLVDLWNVRLESPLMLTLTLPSSSSPEPGGDSKSSVVAGGSTPEVVTPEWQAEWVRHRLPMLLAKTSVQVVLWGQLSDAATHGYAHGGLFDAAGAAKPIVQELRSIRGRYLA